MSIKSFIADNLRLRSLLFPVFSRLNPGDITLRHHYTGAPLRIHSFRHRGYWWHGKNREAETIAAFRTLVRGGATAFDVGTHVGYMSLLFSQLVGPSGRVVSFEPGENNLPYTRANVAGHDNITLVEKAVGPNSGTATIYLEDVTGQNNSLVKDYDGLGSTSRASVSAHVREVTIPMVSLDDFVRTSGLVPDFIKVDVEGFELGVLAGAGETLSAHHPMLMVEVGRPAMVEAIALLHRLGYVAYRPDGRPIRSLADRDSNTFFLHPEHHAAGIRALGWPDAPSIAID